MIPVLDTNAWIEKLRELERPGADNILAFYEHRFGAICRDPRLMLAPLDDHLVHRGDGVFETIRFTERKVIHLMRTCGDSPTPPPGCPSPCPAPSRKSGTSCSP